MFTKQKIKKIIIILITMLLLSVTLFFHNYLNPAIKKMLAQINIVSSKNNLVVHFINVGQGDAVAINLPDGKVLLIDTGCEDYNVTYTDYLKENVLNNKHSKTIDYLVLTHADIDHIGGTNRLLNKFKVNTVFTPRIESDTEGAQETMEYIKQKCNYLMPYDDYKIDGSNYEILFLKQISQDNTNDSSQVVKLKSFNKSFLFMADISSDVEELYMNEYDDFLDCDVLKVAHHGSKTSTSKEFLNFVTPEYSVISVGEDNIYGHPTSEVLNRLSASGSKILRTDKQGNILFVVGKDYKLLNLNDKYYLFSLSLNYQWLIVVMDVVLMVKIVVVIIKKERINKHITDKTLEY